MSQEPAVQEFTTAAQDHKDWKLRPLADWVNLNFPIGVLIYWFTTNLWTMGQQFIVIRNMPTPGSQAAKDREERLARKGKLPKVEEIEAAPEEPKQPQRVQPVSKNRAKKSGKKKAVLTAKKKGKKTVHAERKARKKNCRVAKKEALERNKG